jgi:hypothetical protein
MTAAYTPTALGAGAIVPQLRSCGAATRGREGVASPWLLCTEYGDSDLRSIDRERGRQ